MALLFMTQTFNKCLASGKITPFTPGKSLANKELRLAQEDLGFANKSFDDKNFKWSIVQCYYSMFHSARALLYWQNYREKSHFCLIEAIRTLYVDQGILNSSLVEHLLEAKNLREAADYYGDYSEPNCQKFILRATAFLEKAKEIILQ